jgi:hypothetical protein
MIQIKKYGGRLGNSLFQYAYARLLAEHMGYALRVPRINGFDKVTNIDGEIIKTPEILIKYGNSINHIKDKLETIEQLAKRCENKKVEIFGGGVNVDLYKGKWNDIRKWFSSKTKTILTNEDLVIHVRLGDFLQYKHRTLPIEYYKLAVKTIKHNRLYVCSDSPGHKRLGWFRKIGATIIKKDAIDTFRFIESANKIILSNSSFSWWAAVLSNASEVIMPIGNVLERRDIWTRCKFAPFPGNAKYIHINGKSVNIRG